MPEPASAPAPTMARRHDMDALRATAMLLGIVFHAARQFVPSRGNERIIHLYHLEVFVSVSHGFRMPLFFLLSGFFTAMLWRHRGLWLMVRQRFSRILLPLLVFLPVTSLAFNLAESTNPAPLTKPSNIWEAAHQGDVESLAAFVNAGSDVNIRRKVDGWSPLILTAALGHRAAVEWLIANGADVNSVTPAGHTALDLAAINSHTKVAELIQQNGGISGGKVKEKGILDKIVFRHLWFLWFLWWLVVGFAICAFLVDRLGIKKPPSKWVLTPMRYLWIIPLTMILHSYMKKSQYFGPDTANGLYIPLYILLYYALFFGFGALYFHYRSETRSDSRWGGLALAVGLLVVFPAGTLLTGNAEKWTFPALFFQALFPWTMIFGLIGLFQNLFANESKFIRYVSDSSYFLYIMHLPLVILASNLIHPWQLSNSAKVIFICVVVTGSLLFVYEYLVRYRWLGMLLNGPRQRPAKKPVSVAIEVRGP